MAKNEIRLEQALEILFEKLQQKGILPEMDVSSQKSLLRKTCDNIKDSVDEETLNLKSPETLLKLGTALVATHAMENNKNYTFNFKTLLTKALKDPAVEDEINSLEKELNKQDPEAARKFKHLLVDIVKDILIENPNMKTVPMPEPRMDNGKSPDNKLVGVYDDAGNLLDLLENVYGGKNLYDTILSLNEIISSNFEEEEALAKSGEFMQELNDSFGQRERMNNHMKLTHPGS
jgi:hypothetical protein